MDAIKWAALFGLESISVPARTQLVQEGSIARKMYIIEKGALRIWLNKDGSEITSQFFFEGKLVASLESFLSLQPSSFCLETLEEVAMGFAATVAERGASMRYIPCLNDAPAHARALAALATTQGA